jgi:superfamily II DNA or RNA helicase
MLRGQTWKAVYRSETDNLLEDFYLPALRQSVAYDRAVGFFSATMLSYAAQGITSLVKNDGRMRLIFGGELSSEDAEAIKEGYELRRLNERVGGEIMRGLDDLADALASYRMQALAWMVAQGRLEIKVALKRRGMYHEKIGIFRDAAGDQLVFQGSANETTYALLPDFNFEAINVFPTWRPELEDHFRPYVDGFERLWANESPGTLVIPFPDAARDKLIKISTKAGRPPSEEHERGIWEETLQRYKPTPTNAVAFPFIPTVYKGMPFEIKEHQKRALNAWRSYECRGILAMATGAGKTVSSIYGAVRLFEATQKLFLVVAVPYQPLADQWVDELSFFGINALRCYESTQSWSSSLSQAVSLFESDALSFFACVVVNRTLESGEFQERIKRLPSDALMFIGDECHYHASPVTRRALPQSARFRLGLSATPEHYFDEERTAALRAYYGDIVFEYTLSDALQDKVLTPYKYFVHLIELETDEAEQYVELSEQISRLAARDGSDEEAAGSQLKMLLFKRARVLANARGKTDALSELLRAVPPSPYHLFYCGDAIDVDEEGARIRSVDRVSQLLYDRGWNVSHFTSHESQPARRAILDSFRAGIVDGLVAIRCLDEGVDVPGCRTAYILASSRNPKQFIQRRGRILRRAPNKEEATVHDFLVTLPSGSSQADKRTRDLLVAELARVAEFGRLAINRADVYVALKPLLQRFDVEHHFT